MTAAASDVSSATSAVEALTATTNSAETTPTIASALASFKFGPEEAAKPTMDGDAALIKPLKDAAEAVESVPMDLESSLNQSALKMLQMDYHSNFDSVEDLEDGEVRDKAKLPPPSSTSTPIDLAKSPENKKHQAHGLARKKLELSPPPSPNKVCLNLDMIQDGLAASDKEAACPKFATEPRPIFLKNPDPELIRNWFTNQRRNWFTDQYQHWFSNQCQHWLQHWSLIWSMKPRQLLLGRLQALKQRLNLLLNLGQDEAVRSIVTLLTTTYSIQKLFLRHRLRRPFYSLPGGQDL